MRRDGLGALPRLLALLLAAQAALAPATAHGATVDWERWQKIPGVIDVDGPRSDGSLVVAGSAALYLVDPAGKVAPFARGPGGYHEDAGAEAYLASSPGGTVGAAGCTFVRDETFLLRLHTPIGVNRVNAAGDESGSFANLPGVSALNGIVFDTGGAFDHRLLVSGRSGSKTVIFAVDCNGNVQMITRSAPALEGGLAVAPTGFGAFGGSLIAPDELSGKIYAITPGGVVSVVARPRLRTGSDIGVESVGFVPPGFTSRGGSVYYPDRFSRNNPHPGTDSLLRLTRRGKSGGRPLRSNVRCDSSRDGCVEGSWRRPHRLHVESCTGKPHRDPGRCADSIGPFPAAGVHRRLGDSGSRFPDPAGVACAAWRAGPTPAPLII
ncbi:MAG: hypothetical protein E6J18_06855 [Chloroflexi bacterium]|nr:MAG: hypothetical protein E6J18_06855 [Chloroflexota bacterium]